MRMTFLGAGSAFTTAPGNFQSNMFIEADPPADGDTAKRSGLLIDCGSDARWSLAAQGMSALNIDTVYVSHFHADHVGGMEWLGFTGYFNPECHKPTLILAEPMVEPLWHGYMKPGMEALDFGEASLSDYFDVRPVAEDGSFQWGGTLFEVVSTDHIVSAGTTMLSYGLMIHRGERRIYLTTDCCFDRKNLDRHHAAADLIFQDCDTGARVTCAHAHYTQLVDLPADVKARMWLYHYCDGPLPDARADGFLGFVKPGQVFDLG
jgi:ribonuclease BN (tRNA processing enzyme)